MGFPFTPVLARMIVLLKITCEYGIGIGNSQVGAKATDEGVEDVLANWGDYRTLMRGDLEPVWDEIQTVRQLINEPLMWRVVQPSMKSFLHFP